MAMCGKWLFAGNCLVILMMIYGRNCKLRHRCTEAISIGCVVDNAPASCSQLFHMQGQAGLLASVLQAASFKRGSLKPRAICAMGPGSTAIAKRRGGASYDKRLTHTPMNRRRAILRAHIT